tara:strand:+ start:106 stop:549 length:444 start_codon:yes stop_codon:yes gene_type:complete
MNYKISIFLFSLILFTGCGDDEDSLSNDIDFFSNHAGSVWFSATDTWWLRINNDSNDEYYDGKCVNFPAADGIYNDWDGFQIKQTMTRNEANFVSWDIDYINNEYTDGTGSFSVDASGNKLTYTTSTGLEFIYTKVNDTFPGTDCKN